MTFRSHLDGSIHRFTPEHATAVQEALGSDIAVAFDQPVFPSSRARRSWPTRRHGPIAGRSARWRPTRRPDQAMFGIIQGGLDPELRAASTQFIAGAAVRWPVHRRAGRRRDARAARRGARCRRAAAGRRSASALPDGPRLAGRPARGRPSRHRPVRQRAAGAGRPERPAVGAGRPVEHPQCAVPRRSDPVQDDCPCLLCRRFSRAYLAHLFRAKELLAYRLATCHNLTFTLDFMARIRASIRAGTFPADMSDLRTRAGRMSGGEVAEQSA